MHICAISFILELEYIWHSSRDPAMYCLRTVGWEPPVWASTKPADNNYMDLR